MKPSILLVEDEPANLFGYSSYLSKSGYDLKEATTLAQARETIASQRFSAVILDMVLPDGNGIDLISDLKGTNPPTAVVVVSGKGDIPLAVEAMRRGADNFLTKPVNMEELELFLQKCIELSTLRRRDLTRKRLVRKFEPYFGKTPEMKTVHELVKVAAENYSPVLIQGETGSGKGVLARWIHDYGPRSAASFVEVNCSSLRGELLASELFGHVRGAFTSAVQDRHGLIEEADGCTLFLDEIGDMDLAVQSQFLKVIEEKSYRRLGETKLRRSDFRLICATNKNLNEEVQQGRFRKDLYFRINVLPIVIPPLRERAEDLPELMRHMLNTMGSPDLELPPEVMKLLVTYHWPGNFRELGNVLERAFLLARGCPIVPAYFAGLEQSMGLEKTEARNLVQLEEEHIKAVLIRSNHDMQKAAKALGISRSTLYRKMKKLRETK
jgi:DNA-binding NtrC family response regulator